MSLLQTEIEFTLPRGYVDARGTLHRQGVMRLARAIDEVEPLTHARVRANDAYLSIVLLSRVVARLGEVHSVTPEVIEGLFAADFAYLQELYLRLNDDGSRFITTACPACGARFELDLMADGA
ncbi:MAG: phage tail assembly protein [Blastocatellia bacterium]